jgi:hypothetical protein
VWLIVEWSGIIALTKIVPGDAETSPAMVNLKR